MKKRIKRIWNDQGGMGVVEVILIIIVLIGLVIIFRDSLTDLINNLFDTLTSGAESVGT